MNFDELLDRRQLLNQNVKVIRYKQGATQGHNILISSTAPLSLLRSMVFGRVKDLNLELTDAECRELTEKFINDANEISGDIVLRAAKRGRNASELMGVVLSRYMIRHEPGPARRFGWHFLDDYAEWLGQREEQIADILALTPEQGRIVLIDPKLGVDYFAFEGLRQLQRGIISEQAAAIFALNELVGEMNRRYTVLRENRVANIFDLNRKTSPTERFSFLWVIRGTVMAGICDLRLEISECAMGRTLLTRPV